jgi:hypothetical protein
MVKFMDAGVMVVMGEQQTEVNKVVQVVLVAPLFTLMQLVQ